MTKANWGRLLANAMSLVLCLAVVAGDSLAQGPRRQPELMDGKKTLLKRVIVRPGAMLAPQAAEGGTPIPAFSVYYVYGRSGDYVEVGKAIGAADGFIKADKLSDWKQTIVAVFNNNTRASRERSLLFKSSAAIDEVLRDANPRQRLAQLRAAAAVGQTGDGPVLAIEPENPPDMRQHFYFFPILSVEGKRFGRTSGRVLNVASLSKVEENQPPAARQKSLEEMRVGVVFVIDTTTSMTPYIDRVRKAMERVEAKLRQSPMAQKMRFGLVGFRQSLVDNSPAVEYHVKTFLRLGKEATAAAFAREIASVKESPAPTEGFKEDSLGGISEALGVSEWNEFDARFIVLITDAGPILPESGKHLLAPGLGPSQIQSLAAEKQISILVLHLKTPEGAQDHASAESQYRVLAKMGDKPSYLPVPDGALDRFSIELDKMTDEMMDQVRIVASGENRPPTPTGDPMRDAIRMSFYAMQLSYLGRREGSRAPDMFDAWLADRDLSDPAKEATEIRLILTKNQLATMRDVALGIKESAERSRLSPNQFFDQLRMAIATLARNPDRLVDRNAATLGAALGEFLDGLPYASTSPILSIDQQMWVQMGPARQAEMRVDLERKIAFFDAWYRTPENWVKLTDGVPDGEQVTAFPLEQLP